MYQQFMFWPNMGNPYFAPWAEMQDIQYRAFEKVMKKNIEVGSDIMAQSVQYFQNMQSSKQPQDYAKHQLQLITEGMDGMMDYATEMFDITKNTMQEVQKLAEKNIDSTFAAMKSKKSKD